MAYGELTMSKAAGLFLILSGLTVAAYGIPSDKDASEPEVASRTAATPVPAFATPVVVTIAQRPSVPPAAPPRAAPILRDRDTLARELQKELKRVGCYEGELNGAWTPLTRRAMKAFTDQVNATLPVHEPDAILYALVQGHQDRACGKPCPSGQGLDEDGRCLPNAILARAAKKGPPLATMALSPKSNPAAAETAATAVAGWSTVTTSAAPVSALAVASAPALGPPPAEGRMALAGPTPPPTRARAARRASPPTPRVTVRQVSRGTSWARSMIARRYESLN